MRGIISVVVMFFLYAGYCYPYEVVLKVCEGRGVGDTRKESREESIWDALMKCAQEVGWERNEFTEEAFKSQINPPESFSLGFKEISTTLSPEGKYITDVKVDVDLNFFKKILIEKGLIRQRLLIPGINLEVSAKGNCLNFNPELLEKTLKEKSAEKWSHLLKEEGENVDYKIHIQLNVKNEKIRKIKWCVAVFTIIVTRGESEIRTEEKKESVVPLSGENIVDVLSDEAMVLVERAMDSVFEHWSTHSGFKVILIHIKPWHSPTMGKEIERMLLAFVPQIISFSLTKVDSEEVVYAALVDEKEQGIPEKISEVMRKRGWQVEKVNEQEMNIYTKVE